MGLLDFLFPKYCVGCRKIGSYLCDNCFAYISFDTKQYCLLCGKSSFDGLTHPGCKTRYGIDGVFASIEYKGIVKKLIYKFKYNPYISDLQNILVDLLYEGIIQKEAFYKTLLNKPYIIPVPLYYLKKKKRGYNQAEILAIGLSKRFLLEYRDAVERVRDTKTQVGLSREKRKENVRDAFTIKNEANWKIKESFVLLIDDLVTTGSTFLEIANILKRKGVKNVWGVALCQD